VTGHGRLSYRQAEALFRTTSGGWTLHQLRHSALTHLAEANVALPLLMAKSRHVSLRSLQRYARPGPEAVAALTQRMTQHGGGAERLRMTRLSADERRVLVERLFDQRRTGLPAEEVSRAASYGGTVTSARLLTLARLSAAGGV
jgi:hypothetical protein